MRFVLADIDPVALAKLAIVPMAVVLVVGEAYALRTIRRRPLGSVAGRRVSATGYSAQNVIGSAGIGVAAKVVGLALAVPTLAIGAMVAPLSLVTAPSGAAGVAYAVLVADALLYIFHRLSHRTTLGWASHITHHETPYFDYGVALRVEVFPVVGLAVFPLAALFGVGPEMIAIAFLIHGLYMGVLHTEVIDRLPRWFELVFNTPSHHRVHHLADDRRGHNLGSILIVWDRLFGTFRPEASGIHHYGVANLPDRRWPGFLGPVENFYRVLRPRGDLRVSAQNRPAT